MNDVARQAMLSPKTPVRISTNAPVAVGDVVPVTWPVRAPNWWTVVITIGCVLFWLLLYTCVDLGTAAEAAADRAS